MNTKYAEQLQEKILKIKTLFNNLNPPNLEIFDSPSSHYRMRCELRVWHDGEDLFYFMVKKENKEIKIRIEELPMASLIINQVMKALIEKLKPNKILRHKLFQIDFLSTLSGEVLVTLLYHRNLEDDWKEEALKLNAELSLIFTGNKVLLIGRAKKQYIVLERDYVLEKLCIAGKNLTYKQVENCFTQPNATVAIKMLEWALDVTKNSSGDLLELYCGNGNFSIALASHFRKVLATELSKPSVLAALYNKEVNKIENLEIIRMSAEDFSDALAGKREYNRMKGIDLKSYNCNTVLVDPPRAGLDLDTLSMIKNYENIIYISCNPSTLLENLNILLKTHSLERFAVFDQFPFTEHSECGILLKKK